MLISIKMVGALPSHHPSQGFRFTVHCNRLATSNADISEDPHIDAARQDDSQTQQHQADQGLRAHAEWNAKGGADGVIAGFLS